jgi:hypothetical protein
MEMITTNLNLKRLDKEPVTELDIAKGKQLRNGREQGLEPNVEDDPGLETPQFDLLEDGYEAQGEYDEEPGWEEAQEDSPANKSLQDVPAEVVQDTPADVLKDDLKKRKSSAKNLKGVNIKKRSGQSGASGATAT